MRKVLSIVLLLVLLFVCEGGPAPAPAADCFILNAGTDTATYLQVCVDSWHWLDTNTIEYHQCNHPDGNRTFDVSDLEVWESGSCAS